MGPCLLGVVPLGAGDIVVGGVVIPAAIAEVFRRWRQLAEADLEGCGILVGRESLSGVVLVDEVTTPLPGDVRGPMTCERLDPGHAAFVRDRWRASNGAVNYLGSWHTHPEDRPSPSALDVREWVEEAVRLRSERHNLRLVHLVVGRTHVAVWEVDAATSR